MEHLRRASLARRICLTPFRSRVIRVNLSLLVLPAALAAQVHVTEIDRERARDLAVGDVVVYERGESFDKQYDVLGVVTTYAGVGSNKHLNYPGPVPPKLVERLEERARQMGANALVGTQRGRFMGMNDGGTFASALAVRLLEPGVAPTSAAPAVSVCVLPVYVEEGQTKDDPSELDRRIRIAARWLLTVRGYYAVAPDAGASKTTIEEYREMPRAALEEVCGPDVGRFLAIELATAMDKGFVVGKGKGLSLQGAFFSDEAPLASPDIEGAGFGTAGFLLRPFGVAKIAAIEATVASLLESFPYIITGGEPKRGKHAKAFKKQTKAAGLN